jgi:TolA-binding protein
VQAATKPTIDADAALSIESLRTPVRAEQEQILVQLIANTPDSEAEEKSDYYFRLGELYAKQALFWRKKAAELATATTPVQRKQAANAANEAKVYLLKAVKTYKGLTDNDAFRNYPKLDMALFYYGYTLQGGKYMKEARAVYDKLLKNFPNSKYVPEAHLAFADYFYDAGQLADAEARYKQVLEFPKSTAYAYALYKLGWVQVQLQRSQDAAATFYKAIAATRGDVKRLDLHRAARAAFVNANGQLGKPADEALKKLDKTLAAELAGELAVASYAQWAQTQTDEALTQAEQQYATYVAAFPDDDDAHGQYAEVLWTRADHESNAKLRGERWARTAETFATIHTQEAARATALAWMNAIDVALPADTKVVLAKTPRKTPRAQPLDKRETNLVAAVAAYAALGAVDDDELGQMQLAVAIVLRSRHRFDEAATALDQFLEQHPDHAQAELAANLLLDSMIQARKLDELGVVADAMAADHDFVDDKPDLLHNLTLVRARR